MCLLLQFIIKDAGVQPDEEEPGRGGAGPEPRNLCRVALSVSHPPASGCGLCFRGPLSRLLGVCYGRFTVQAVLMNHWPLVRNSAALPEGGREAERSSPLVKLGLWCQSQLKGTRTLSQESSH